MPKGIPNLTEEQKQATKEARLKYATQYYKDHPYGEHDTVNRLYWAAKHRARIKGLEFNIEKEDIIIPTHCPYLGIELVKTRKRGDSRRDIASLDRIVPTLGYIKGNVEVLSWLANTMKNNATPELLVKFAKVVLERYEGSLGR